MKTNFFSASLAGAVIGLVLKPSVGHSQTGAPEGLGGTITAAQGMVTVGQRVSLEWATTYPMKKFDPENTPKCRVKVRVIGQGVTGSNSPGTYFFAPTHATMSINNPTDFRSIFYGINPDVNPATIISLSNNFGSNYTDDIVQAGSKLCFGGYWEMDGQKGFHYKSNDGTNNIRYLYKGDVPPPNVPDYNAPSLESFLRPYLDPTGKVDIEDKDVIVFMELTHSAAQQSQPGYDLQDIVLLVSFEPIN